MQQKNNAVSHFPTVKVSVFDTHDELINSLAEKIGKSSNRIIIPGGTTAEFIIKAIEIAGVDISNTSFYLTDDRLVPHSSDKSNFGFLSQSGVLKGKISPWNGSNGLLLETGLLNKAVEELESNGFSLVLGVGADGHIASLFPDDSFFDDNRHYRIIHKDEDDFLRFSLSMNLLLHAKDVKVVFFGSQKKQVFEFIQSKDLSKPIVLFLEKCYHKNIDIELFTTAETV